MLPLHVIKWMFFSSAPLSAEEATCYGFINACVPADQFGDKARGIRVSTTTHGT